MFRDGKPLAAEEAEQGGAAAATVSPAEISMSIPRTA
jgi:hypothetical protein